MLSTHSSDARQIQALNRSAPILPTTPQKATHDHEPNGTLDLFAALNIATGTAISHLRKTHTAADFITFLGRIDTEVPSDLDVHVSLDNLSTHKTPAVHEWLQRHRRFQLHFTPTYGSWMNLVEHWFSALATKKLRAVRSSQRQSPRRRHHRLGRKLEPEPHTLHLAQDRGRDPHPPRRLLHRHQQIDSVSALIHRGLLGWVRGVERGVPSEQGGW